jgi:hypothetical protein
MTPLKKTLLAHIGEISAELNREYRQGMELDQQPDLAWIRELQLRLKRVMDAYVFDAESAQRISDSIVW